MKTCPQCGTQYSDDTLLFCLQDGSPLAEPLTETPTVFLGDEETVAARRNAVRVPISDPEPAAWDQSRVTQTAPATSEKKGSNTALIVAVTAVVMLIIFGVIGIAAIVFLRNAQQASVQNSYATPANVRTGNNSDSSTPAVPSPTKTAASTPKPPPSPSPTIDNELPPPPPGVPYPSTTRLKFGRGSYTTSFGGDINPGDSRSLVLACRSGQSLSANVTSGGGCVTIRGGGTSLQTTTSSGDNYITLSNRCSSIVKFRITVTVI
jgi:hypothetical protein